MLNNQHFCIEILTTILAQLFYFLALSFPNPSPPFELTFYSLALSIGTSTADFSIVFLLFLETASESLFFGGLPTWPGIFVTDAAPDLSLHFLPFFYFTCSSGYETYANDPLSIDGDAARKFEFSTTLWI